jgi:HAD superfamily hydrolase (TIGR01490 family)
MPSRSSRVRSGEADAAIHPSAQCPNACGEAKAVFVDLDGTLVGGPSSEARFFHHLLIHGLLGPRQMLAAAAFFAVHGLRLGRRAAHENKAYLHGIEVGVIARRARDWVRTELVPQLRQPMLDRLDLHRHAGEHIVLLTGAPDFIAEPLAARIGAIDWIATRPAVIDGCFASDPPVQHPFGEAKVECARAWCAGADLRLSDCAAYADTRYDLPLLKAVGRAVAVAPDAILEQEARRRGWEILIGDRWERSACLAS